MRAISALKADTDLNAVAFHCVPNRFCVFVSQTDRFLNDEMFPRFCSGDGLLRMKRMWRTNIDDMYVRIGKYLVMEHEPVAGRISLVLVPENLGW